MDSTPQNLVKYQGPWLWKPWIINSIVSKSHLHPSTVCDLPRPSTLASSDDQNKIYSFCFFPMEKKGPRRLENSGLPVLDCAILQCMSPAFRKTIPGLRRMYNSYAQFVWFDSLKYTRHFFTEDFIKSNIPLMFNRDCSMIFYFKKFYVFYISTGNYLYGIMHI